MAGDAKAPPSRGSFAGSDPALRRDLPRSLREQRPSRTPFDYARDPLKEAQHRAARKTESERRKEGGRGSHMVRLHRPFPVLRPTFAPGSIRGAFDEAWFKEQRAARCARYQAQRQAQGPRLAAQFDQRRRTPPGRSR